MDGVVTLATTSPHTHMQIQNTPNIELQVIFLIGILFSKYQATLGLNALTHTLTHAHINEESSHVARRLFFIICLISLPISHLSPQNNNNYYYYNNNYYYDSNNNNNNTAERAKSQQQLLQPEEEEKKELKHCYKKETERELLLPKPNKKLWY